MSTIDITKDLENATLTVTSVFEASPERVWQLWSDPRQLERWWGPSPYPATVVDHDLRPGGRVSYYMTSPEGDKHHGYWRVLDVTPPHRLVLEDGFADEDGQPDADLPTNTTIVTVEAIDDTGTRMTIEGVYSTSEAFEQVLGMGVTEGIRIAVSQIDAVLADG
ncbi:MAG: SRPBCC domain-containing protein [Nitriliruptoraceae bacterium]